MTVNQFMITDYTELLQLVDLAAGQSGVLKDGSVHQKEFASRRVLVADRKPFLIGFMIPFVELAWKILLRNVGFNWLY